MRALHTTLWLAANLAFTPGCAHRGEDRTRQAFEAAREAPKTGGSGNEDQADPSVTTPDRFAVGWERVGAIVKLSARELSAGDPERVLRLADRWCASEPNVRDTEHGPVVVCFPEPPIQAGGHGFTLELGDGGMVGMVSASLSGAESHKLAREARREGDAWCVEPWQPASSPDDFQVFHTCAVEGGAVLTVGRLPRDLEADLWQVSVTLLGAT